MQKRQGIAFLLAATALAAAFVLYGSSRRPAPPPTRRGHGSAGPLAPRTTIDSDIAASIIFAGDGGGPNPDALKLLASEVRLLPGRTRVIFLGDNVYPRGMPRPDDPEAVTAANALNEQFSAVKENNGAPYFIPGNHDWDYSGPDG